MRAVLGGPRRAGRSARPPYSSRRGAPAARDVAPGRGAPRSEPGAPRDDATRPADRRHRDRLARRRAAASRPARSSPSTAPRRSTSARASTSTSTARSRGRSPAAASRAPWRRRRSAMLERDLAAQARHLRHLGRARRDRRADVRRDRPHLHPPDPRRRARATLARADRDPRRAPGRDRDAARRRARRREAVRRRGGLDRHARRPGAAGLQRRPGGARADDPGPLDGARVRGGRRVARQRAARPRRRVRRAAADDDLRRDRLRLRARAAGQGPRLPRHDRRPAARVPRLAALLLGRADGRRVARRTRSRR